MSAATKATHTPGPWHRNIRASGKYPTVFAGRNTHVAQVSQQADPAETEANIDLIAAAPDLLAALRDLEIGANTVARCYSHRPENFAAALRDLRAYAERARAAIAKAGGVA